MAAEVALKKREKIEWRVPLLKFLYRFFAAGASIAGEIMPFGTAFYAADYKKGIPYMACAGILLRTLLLGPLYVIKYVATLLFFTVFIKRFTYIEKKPLRRGLLMGGSAFLSGFLMLLGNNILWYDLVLMITEAALTCVFTLIFTAFNKTFLGRRFEGFSGENIFYAACAAAVVNIGIAEFINFYGFSFSCAFAAFLALVFSGGGGLAQAAATGLILGFSAGFDSVAVMMCTFSIASMCTSYFSKYGKSAAAVSFFLAVFIMLIYFEGFTESIVSIYSILFGTTVYVLLPAGAAKKIIPCIKSDKNSASRLSTLARRDIMNSAEALSDVAATFSMLCNINAAGIDDAATVFFDKTIKWVCTGCKRTEVCWKRDFHITYAAFFVMLRLCEEKGELKPSDLPESIRESCLNPARLITAYNTKIDTYKTDKLWEGRINEARNLIAMQLSSLAKTFYDNAEKFYSGVKFDSVAEAVAQAKLAEHKIDADVSVFEEGNRIRCEVNIFEGEENRKYVEPIISQSLGMPMQVVRDKGDYLGLVFKSVNVGAFCSGLKKDEKGVSGDSFGRVFSPFGTEYFILSDGMGSGEVASQNSRAAVSLVKNMLAAGFPEEVTLGMANSLFMLKSSETSFATLDIVAIEEEYARFTKVGAAESYVKTRGEIVKVGSESLPAGVVAEPEAEKHKIRIGHGSIIIMMSDGVSETLSEGQIKEVLENFSGDSKALCKRLLDLAAKNCGSISDDMTVASLIIE